MARASKYESRWYDSPKGGTLKRVHFRLWFAIPKNKLGTNHLRTFDNEAKAIEYADHATTWTGFGPYSNDMMAKDGK